MMITTHLLGGLLLGAAANSLLTAKGLMFFAVAGALFPDIDMFIEHRKTFHRPFQFLMLSFFFSLLGLFSPYFLLPAIFILSCSIHAFVDILSNGKTMRPWEMKDDRAVFNHITGNWIQPKRYFYDGSSTDLAVSLTIAILLSTFYNLKMAAMIVFSLSLLYTLVRKKITQPLQEYDRFSEYFQDYLL